MKGARRRIAVVASGVTLALGATVFAGWWQVDGPGAPSAPTVGDGAEKIPLPLSAMDFELTDHRGRAVRPSDWIGRPTLVFFGFTYCPDVCPTTLSNIAAWLDDLGDGGRRLNVAFVSVDPERDTPEALADYVSAFHPRIVGHTGTPEQVAGAARAFRVAYAKVQAGGDYTMDHTALVFLMDRNGRFSGTIDIHEDRRSALSKLRRLLGITPIE